MVKRIRANARNNTVGYIAVAIALVGVPAAGAVGALSGSEKKVVKKIAAEQANKQINERAPDLTVKHASSADTATTATNAVKASQATSADNATHATSADTATIATSANPVAFATVNAGGTIVAAQSKNVVQGNVFKDSGAPGTYCFNGLSFTPKGATVAMLDNASSATVAKLDIPFNTLACGIVGPQVLLTMSNGGGAVNQSFFIVFYN